MIGAGRLRSPWVVAAVVVAGGYVAVAALWIVLAPASLGADVVLLADAARRVLDGEPLYLDPTGARFYPGGPDLYYGPPTLVVPALLLTGVPDAVLRAVTFPLSWAAVILAVRRLIGDLRLAPSAAAAVWVGTLLSYAVFGATTLGASSLVVLVAGAFAVRALARDDHRTVGLLVGTAAALRIYPSALLLSLIVARRWRSVAWAVAAIVGWFAITALVLGPAQVAAFAELVPRLAGVAGGASDLTPDGPLGAAAVATGVVFLVLAGRRIARPADPARLTTDWGLALAGMLLVAPIAWDHYLTALLPLVVGVVAESAAPAFGLLGAGLTNAAWGSGVMLFVLPIIALVVRLRVARRTAEGPEP